MSYENALCTTEDLVIAIQKSWKHFEKEYSLN